MKKNIALNILTQLATVSQRKRYPSTPYLPIPKFDDKTSNGLTRCIIKFLHLSDHQAERISVTGRRIDQRITYTDVIGHRRRIGSIKWIRSSMQKGTADISATINGRSVKIEVKIGRDRQRQAQKEYQQQVESAGGVYVIATSFEQFYDWYMMTFSK